MEENRAAWERGWQQNLDEARAANFAPDTLKPKYFRGHRCLRWQRGLVVSDNPQIEYDLFVLARRLLFGWYLSGIRTIYEIGSGSGNNLWLLSELFPEATIVGLDWVDLAVKLANELGKATGRKIEGRRFNMLNPAHSLRLEPGSAVVTIHSLEQLADQHGALLDWLTAARPALVLHYEPILEFYDTANLLDYLALGTRSGVDTSPDSGPRLPPAAMPASSSCWSQIGRAWAGSITRRRSSPGGRRRDYQIGPTVRRAERDHRIHGVNAAAGSETGENSGTYEGGGGDDEHAGARSCDAEQHPAGKTGQRERAGRRHHDAGNDPDWTQRRPQTGDPLAEGAIRPPFTLGRAAARASWTSCGQAALSIWRANEYHDSIGRSNKRVRAGADVDAGHRRSTNVVAREVSGFVTESLGGRD